MKRRTAREIAVQSLYQLEMNEVSTGEAVATVIEERNDDEDPESSISISPHQHEFIHHLVEGTWNQREAIDAQLSQYLKGWKIDRLSKVDKQILRLATFEMCLDESTPPKVVINEAIELSKLFGTEESGKFVNGVLGKMIHDIEQIKQNIIVQEQV